MAGEAAVVSRAVGGTAEVTRATAVVAKEEGATTAAPAVAAEARQVRHQANGVGVTAGQAVTSRNPG